MLLICYGLQDGFAFGGKALNVVADELLHIRLTLEEECAADPRKLVGPVLRHIQRKLFGMLPIDQMGFDSHPSSSSIGLNLS